MFSHACIRFLSVAKLRIIVRREHVHIIHIKHIIARSVYDTKSMQSNGVKCHEYISVMAEFSIIYLVILILFANFYKDFTGVLMGIDYQCHVLNIFFYCY